MTSLAPAEIVEIESKLVEAAARAIYGDQEPVIPIEEREIGAGFRLVVRNAIRFGHTFGEQASIEGLRGAVNARGSAFRRMYDLANGQPAMRQLIEQSLQAGQDMYPLIDHEYENRRLY